MGKVVVITGASGGIGRAAAREFAGQGAAIALLARGETGLQAAREEVERGGGRALIIPTDVADAEQVEAAAERAERELGPIDVWVNNAMATVFSPVKDLKPSDVKRTTEVTYLGVVNGTLAALKYMLPRDRGCIVQVGSALAYRAVPLQAAYCASKYAIRGFTDALQAELIHDRSNVKVTMVQLSAFNTPQFDWGRSYMSHKPQPLPPIFQPELAARAIAAAADRPRREFWVGLPALQMILGSRLAPGALLDRVLARKAYDGQLDDEPAEADRPDILYRPVDRDYGAHGRFDGQAKPHSGQLWLNLNRGAVAAASVAAIALAAIGIGWWR